jgi:hypothetical protein
MAATTAARLIAAGVAPVATVLSDPQAGEATGAEVATRT